jgi:hypothetical protein
LEILYRLKNLQGLHHHQVINQEESMQVFGHLVPAQFMVAWLEIKLCLAFAHSPEINQSHDTSSRNYGSGRFAPTNAPPFYM